MEFNFSEIEQVVKKLWREQDVYRVEIDHSKEKCYVLDMFPYPSGVGLHVGHPLGYVGSDICARYKRLRGFNVLHPMGYDSFGLPAEQYAIQTGQHPAITAEQNIKTFREQMDKLGFSFDWSRQIKTSDPDFYKWTQWIFIQLFHSWYNKKTDKAEPIASLIEEFERNGNVKVLASSAATRIFSAEEWRKFSDKEKSDVLLNYRLAYIADSWVNWCAALGTVLANDEVKDGVSERGGYPVERKLMKQWSLRITAYAERLLKGLEKIDWSHALKEMQQNWIGKSEGCSVTFEVMTGENFPLLKRGAGSEEEAGKPGYVTTDQALWFAEKERGRRLRKDQTEAEKLLWENLRNKKLGYRFRRQHAIDQFIVDFVSLEKRVVVELDGEYHKEQKEYDDFRTGELSARGYQVIRFWNEEVTNDIQKVLNKINAALGKPHPEPLPKGEGSHHSKEVGGREVLSFGEDLGEVIEVFTTRPDTIFGATFIALAPEHDLVSKITTSEHKEVVEEYVTYAKNRSERDRMADVKKITGQFTGAYAIHPFSKEMLPVWVTEYVLATYGTGALMGVPGHDDRDHRFAKHFGLPIPSIIEGVNVDEEAHEIKEGKLANSDFLNGLDVKDAIKKAIDEIEKLGIGKSRVNYKLRDAIFGRQRYWGEPIPIYYDEKEIPKTVEEEDLPLVLPEIDKYLPTETGEPPVARAVNWKYKGKYEYEKTTMPGWAGSSWYYLRYEDPNNEKEFASKEAIDYWKNVDLYVGGDEHAVGHLLYFRFWTKFLFDRGWIPFDEPAKKLVNQGKIQGLSAFMLLSLDLYSVSHPDFSFSKPQFIVSKKVGTKLQQMNELEKERVEKIIKKKLYEHNPSFSYDGQDDFHVIINYPFNLNLMHIPIQFVNDKNELDIERYVQSIKELSYGGERLEFILEEDGTYICHREVEKMSKRYGNVVNPDDVVAEYGADAFRMYEMFLGPLEQHKPWDTKGIDGVFRFLKKMWRLFYDETGNWWVNEDEPTKEELKILSLTIKKVGEDIESLAFNTAVSAFMICVNELSQLNVHKRKILEPLLITLSPFAPFITEYLWQKLGYQDCIVKAYFPQYDESLLVETSFEYPVAVNGKTRVKMNFDLDLPIDQIEKEVLTAEALKKYFDGKTPKKVIVVKGRMINVVV